MASFSRCLARILSAFCFLRRAISRLRSALRDDFDLLGFGLMLMLVVGELFIFGFFLELGGVMSTRALVWACVWAWAWVWAWCGTALGLALALGLDAVLD